MPPYKIRQCISYIHYLYYICIFTELRIHLAWSFVVVILNQLTHIFMRFNSCRLKSIFISSVWNDLMVLKNDLFFTRLQFKHYHFWNLVKFQHFSKNMFVWRLHIYIIQFLSLILRVRTIRSQRLIILLRYTII